MNRKDAVIIGIIFCSLCILVVPLLIVADLLSEDTIFMTIVTIVNTLVYLIAISILIASTIHYYVQLRRKGKFYHIHKVMNVIRMLLLICAMVLFPFSFEASLNILGWIFLFILITDSPYGHSFHIIENQVVYSSEKSSSSYIITRYSKVGDNAIEIQLDNGKKKTISFSKKESKTMEEIMKELDVVC